MNSARIEPSIPVDSELRWKLECLEGLLTSAPVGLGLLDSQFRYVWVNPVLAALNGLPPEHHPGRTVREVHPALAETLEPLQREILASGVPTADFCLLVPQTDSSRMPMSSKGRLRLLQSSNGLFLGITLSAYPQSDERNRGNIAGQEPWDELDQQGYRSIEFLAHALKNALAPILSAAQMLQRYGVSKPDVVDWAGASIESQVRAMSSTVNELLDFSRAILGRLELEFASLNLTPVLERTIAACRGLAEERNQTLHCQLSAGELWVTGDETRLEYVIQQLLLNAVRSAPEGGIVALRADLEDGSVVIRVGDDSAGLAPAMLDAIFEPLIGAGSSGDPKARGLGVGVAFARRLISLHGGTLRVVSEGLGCGAEFVAQLPAIPPSAVEGGRKQPGTTAAAQDTETLVCSSPLASILS